MDDKTHRRLDDDEWAWLVIALIDIATTVAIGSLYFWFVTGATS